MNVPEYIVSAAVIRPEMLFHVQCQQLLWECRRQESWDPADQLLSSAFGRAGRQGDDELLKHPSLHLRIFLHVHNRRQRNAEV